MTLNISCPNCALNFPLVAGLNEADAKRYAALMGELPPALAKPLTQYLALFKPAKTGLTWSRALKLLGELLPDIRRGQVRRNGRDWPAPADYWSLAIQTMLEQRDKLTLPMLDPLRPGGPHRGRTGAARGGGPGAPPAHRRHGYDRPGDPVADCGAGANDREYAGRPGEGKPGAAGGGAPARGE